MNAVTKILVSLFELLKLYSRQNGLGDHLKGMDKSCNLSAGQSIYSMVFLYLFVINTAIIVNYYYGIFNRIPFHRWIWWLLNVLVGAGILFVIGFSYTHNDLENKNYCSELAIKTSDCFGFAWTAGIYSVAWSVVLSYIIKWWSTINKIVNPFYFI
jgi:hypothetical protein